MSTTDTCTVVVEGSLRGHHKSLKTKNYHLFLEVYNYLPLQFVVYILVEKSNMQNKIVSRELEWDDQITSNS